jgi:DNA ligase-1
MRLRVLAETSDAVAATRSRLEKVRLLAGFLRDVEPEERRTAVAWLSGVHPGGRLGIGVAAVRALRDIPPAGSAVLSIDEARRALDALRDITGNTVGHHTFERALTQLAALLKSATDVEQRFLVRLLLGELRQGALEGVMADGIAAAARLDPAAVRRAIMLAGDAGAVAEAVLAEGEAALGRFRLGLYEFVKPMLASPAADIGSALGDLGEAALEYKLDGARVQIHKGGAGTRLYSRSGRDVTASVPEIVAQIEALPATGFVLDGEVLALDPSGRPRPFQDTMRRFGRKLAVDTHAGVLPLSLFCFDCLHAAGEDLIDRPTAERSARLTEIVRPELLVPRIVTGDLAAAERFLADAIEAGHEGVMAKALDAPYEAGSRGAAWLKIKLAHTLDLVVLAAEWGSGRRRGWLSNLHLGARDPAGGFVMLGKTFKGLTDEMLAWQTDRLESLAVSRDGHIVHVRPELVVEIAFNELQASRRYPGGLALRFARVLRYRTDKRPEEADTIETVRAIAKLRDR